MANNSHNYTASVDADTNAIGFVLGKGRKNFNDLKLQYPDVKIWMTQNGPYTTFNLSSHSANRLDSCQNEMEKLKTMGESNYESVVQRKRVVKNIETQRQKIMASKKIRDALENEMKSKHREEVQKKITSNLEVQSVSTVATEKGDMKQIIGNNRFGGLDIE
jgi:hypothetical protein